MLAFSRGISEYHIMTQIELAVFEDEDSVRQLIRYALEDTPYTVVAEATTRQKALDIVTAMHAGELAIGAVLLDGNLDNKENRLFSDAHAIYNHMHSLGRPEPVVGISGDRLAEHGIPIPRELDVTKWCIVSQLVPALDSIFEPSNPLNSKTA